MMKVSTSLPHIAVLRGGSSSFKDSMKEGGEVLSSLSRIGYEPMDVLVDRDGTWTQGGQPTTPHSVFSSSHTVVDTTKEQGKEHHLLAHKMKLPLFFTHNSSFQVDREDIYRLLRQHGVRTPSTLVIRASVPLAPSLFRELWLTFHTPLLVRPLRRIQTHSSVLVTSFHDLEKIITQYHSEGVDVHVLTYRKGVVTSIALLPHFRYEEAYTPLWVDIFPEPGQLPSRSSRMSPHFQAPAFKKDHIKHIVDRVYQSLPISGPCTIDMILHNNTYTIVNVDLTPSLSHEGRFMKSLATTGVDVGQYIHDCITYELTR